MRIGWTVVAEFEVPEGRVFFFERVGVGYEQGAAGDMHFGVLVDDTPIGIGFGDFTYEIGALNFADMCEVRQRIPGPATVTIEARIPDGLTNYQAYGRLFGFIGPDV